MLFFIFIFKTIYKNDSAYFLKNLLKNFNINEIFSVFSFEFCNLSLKKYLFFNNLNLIENFI